MTQTTTPTTPAPPLPSPKERRRLREAKDMTEKQVAAAMGVTPSTVRSWETGRTTPRGRKREAYARLLASYAADSAAKTAAARKAATHAPPAGTDPARSVSTRPGPANAPPAAKAPAEAPGTTPSRKEPLNDRPVRKVEPDNRARRTAQRREAKAQARAGAAADAAARLTPAQAFDELYASVAPGLIRQTYLLTWRHTLSQESVERAFHLAWHRWPEVAVDRDPVGWVRAAAYDYAMSPWHRLRRAHRHPDPSGSERAGRALREALLDLPPVYRRTLLLYDGLGLDLPETAAEIEASTPATANRLLHAREAIGERLPELREPEILHEQLGALVGAVAAQAVAPAGAVRAASEHRAKLWTRAVIAVTVLIVGATAFTVATAPRQYEPVPAPGERVGGVPAPMGPQKLSEEDTKLRDKLRSVPLNGPERLLPGIPGTRVP